MVFTAIVFTGVVAIVILFGAGSVIFVLAVLLKEALLFGFEIFTEALVTVFVAFLSLVADFKAQEERKDAERINIPAFFIYFFIIPPS